MIRVSRRGAKLVLAGDLGPHLGDLQSIPGAQWSSTAGRWLLPASPVAAAEVAQKIPTAALNAESAALADLCRERHRRLAAMRRGDEPPTYREGLWRHQRAAVYVASVAGGVLLDYGMRSGKSRITLETIETCNYSLCLVVCPLKVIATWPEEAVEHGFTALSVTPLAKGSVAVRCRAASKAVAAGGRRVLVINYESVWREPFGPWALKQPWELLVLDEVHKLASPSGRASRYLARLAERVPHRIGLSGTPVGDGPINAYGIFRALDPGVFGTSAALFRAEYVNEVQLPSGARIPHPAAALRYRNTEQFNRRYNLITLKGDRAASDMPPETDTTLRCELSGAAARAYRSMRDELIAELRGGTITAGNAMVKVGKLHQLAAGHVKHEDGRVEEVHREKDGLLAEVLDELGPVEPVVIFAWYVADLARIHAACEAAGRECLEVSGRRDDLAAWKAGAGSAIAVQIQAGGVGVDLSRACQGIYWTTCHSHPLYVQSRARLLGQKDRRPVSFTHLVAARTVDEGIYRALERKAELLDDLLRAPEEVL